MSNVKYDGGVLYRCMMHGAMIPAGAICHHPRGTWVVDAADMIHVPICTAAAYFGVDLTEKPEPLDTEQVRWALDLPCASAEARDLIRRAAEAWLEQQDTCAEAYEKLHAAMQRQPAGATLPKFPESYLRMAEYETNRMREMAPPFPPESPGVPMKKPVAIIAVEDDDRCSHSVYRCYRCGAIIGRAVMQLGHLSDERARAHAEWNCPNQPEF